MARTTSIGNAFLGLGDQNALTGNTDNGQPGHVLAAGSAEVLGSDFESNCLRELLRDAPVESGMPRIVLPAGETENPAQSQSLLDQPAERLIDEQENFVRQGAECNGTQSLR